MRLIKFSMTTCGPCRALAQVLHQVELPCELVEVDCEIEPETAAEYGVFQVPTLVLVDEAGREVKRQTGFMAKPQLEMWVKVDE